MHYSEAIEHFSLLPPLTVLIPAVGAVAVALAGGRREKWRNILAVLFGLLTLAVTVVMALPVFGGSRLFFEIPFFKITPSFSLKLDVDAFGAAFALLAALVWTATLIHATGYMSHEHKRTRFFTFLMLTEAAALGVFLVRDFFSLFAFFEVSGLAAYFLVVHTETPPARAAAKKYIFMTIIGGLSLLAGILFYYNSTGTVSFNPASSGVPVETSLLTAAVILMIGGFGVKAGMIPLHVWLPDAHANATVPAHAILSSVMIKAGAYGILRVITSFFYAAPAPESGHGPSLIQSVGLTMIVIAAVTMFAGMVLAVRQSDIKRTLAYSSISQMGFILLGAGCLAYLGEEGAIGLAGSVYHILCHAFFKGTVFLMVGSITYRLHELNMFKLGGLYRKMPFTTLLWCIGALGVAGVPLFNGFASKTLLHDAVIEARNIALNGPALPAFLLGAAEIIFVISASGTVLYFLKMIYYIFFRRPAHSTDHAGHDLHSGHPEHHEDTVKEAPVRFLIGAGILATGVILIGLFPNFILERIIVPGSHLFSGLDETAVEHLGGFAFFTWHNILNIIIPLSIGVTAFVIAIYLRLFEETSRVPEITHLKIPAWFSFNYWYVNTAKMLETALSRDFVFALPEDLKSWIISVAKGIGETPRAFKGLEGDIATGTLVVAAVMSLLLLLKFLLGAG